MPPLDIPEVVIDRLPVYYRLLSRMREEGETVVSSHELGDALGITPAQIRKDLSYFGRFGKQGRGYSVDRLAEELGQILGLTRTWTLVLIGMGRLGQAIASYRGFDTQSMNIAATFDADPAIIGTNVNGDPVRDVRNLERDLKDLQVDIGVVAVPAERAQAVIDQLVHAGIRALLNYAPVAVQVPEGVEVRQVDPVLQLQSMTYHLTRRLNQRA
ncbi:MAG: redox-sensing transcriptional repressor Rex [Dehalococcoidia bacterium]|nr:redox-sensing transcriptional repressor Rex [Dehalococcoidia bacterium]